LSLEPSFVFDQPARRVIFGAGSLDQLPSEVERAGIQRALVVSTPGRRFADEAASRLGGRLAGLSANAAMHVPIETVHAARARARELGVDGLIAIGGGSTIGLAKAVALDLAVPIVAVPTTYAGSEMTPIYGISEAGQKKTARDRRVVPKVVVYDPLLTLSLPPQVSGPSGMNAIAHCIEALYARDGNPVITLVSAEAIRVLSRSLPLVVRTPDDLAARTDALYGAWLAGTALGAVGMAIHHRVCHVLGGAFNLPHAEAHAVILPHAAAFNRDGAPEAMRTAADALGAADAARGLYDLAVRLGAPTSLKEIGMREDGLDRAAQRAAENPPPNPRPIDYEGVRALLEAAYRGERP
jgi:alcohol dehydrogenase class IV